MLLAISSDDVLNYSDGNLKIIISDLSSVGTREPVNQWKYILLRDEVKSLRTKREGSTEQQSDYT